MNIENAKIAIDKMASFLPDYILNDLYKDHNATAHNISKDDSKVVFSVVFNDGEKRILTITVKRNVGADDVRLHRHEINVHYNGTMQVFSQLITAEFYSDIVNVLFPEDSSLDVQQIKSGFIEAMYFADGADGTMKDDEGFYLDGQFNNCFDLSKNAQNNIISLLETIVPKLPAEVFDAITLDRVGMCIYYEVQGHGTGFQDEDLSEETQENLYQLFFNSVFLEIYDNDETQEIELTYTENWN